MKTSDLIELLSLDAGPVRRQSFSGTIAIAVAAGLVAAVGMMSITLGVRDDLGNSGWLLSLVVKLLFALTVVGLAAAYLRQAAHPGGRLMPVALALSPFVAIVALATISLLSAPSERWQAMTVGDQWLECLLSIPIIAIVPFALLVWAVRREAPTDLRRAGILTGLTAGGVSAAAYALHCGVDSLPYVALWYGGTIALCTLAGAVLGPRLLRW